MVARLFARVNARHNYSGLLMEAAGNRFESFFHRSRRDNADKAPCNSLLVRNKFRVRVEPRANLRLSEMLLGKFRVAAAEVGSFMRAYL